MSSDICGNCSSFSPVSGERFFNCARAGHAGLGYGMQVRADTRACDRFAVSEGPPLASTPEAAAVPEMKRQEPAEPGLCDIGQRSLVLAVGFSILLVTWLLYTCATV